MAPAQVFQFRLVPRALAATTAGLMVSGSSSSSGGRLGAGGGGGFPVGALAAEQLPLPPGVLQLQACGGDVVELLPERVAPCTATLRQVSAGRVPTNGTFQCVSMNSYDAYPPPTSPSPLQFALCAASGAQRYLWADASSRHSVGWAAPVTMQHRSNPTYDSVRRRCSRCKTLHESAPTHDATRRWPPCCLARAPTYDAVQPVVVKLPFRKRSRRAAAAASSGAAAVPLTLSLSNPVGGAVILVLL